MREPVTRRAVLDDAAFDAAVRRVVERTVAAAADDTAGARVVARLLDPPTWRLGVAQMLLAPAAMALVALVLLQESRTTSPVVTARPGVASQPPIDGAAGIEASASPGSTAALDNRGADRRVLVGVSMAAVASSARRRARPRVVAAPLDDDPSAPTALVVSGTAAGTPPGLIEMTPAPEPLPVDALELAPLDAAALDPGHDE
jgi:hypothetical protein